MANYSGKLLKFLYDKWDKHKVLKSANEIIKYTQEKTQTQFTNSITNSTILQQLRAIPLNPVNPLPKSLVNWWQWYQYLVGLNTVEKARQEVILLQNRLTKCREIRRVLRQEAFINNNKVKEVYDELLRTRRDDPKYVTLTILENKTLQEQSKNTEQLNLLEEEEKDYFVQLTTAINEYQDAQALNAQKYKYLSIVASAIAALLSLISSMIYNNKRINNIKQSILELQTKNETIIVNRCNSLERCIEQRFSKLESNLMGQNSQTMGRIAKGFTRWNTIPQTANKIPQTANEIPQTANEILQSGTVPNTGWVDTLKKTAYIFSVLLMLKGLMM